MPRTFQDDLKKGLVAILKDEKSTTDQKLQAAAALERLYARHERMRANRPLATSDSISDMLDGMNLPNVSK